LRAYRALPAEWVSPEVEASRRQTIETILNANIYQYGKGKPSPRWLTFGFPLQWDTDVLEVLELAASHISPEDERIQEALELVLSKQDDQGRWPCEKGPKGGRSTMKKYIELEELGKPSKWVTLHAMKMLKTLYAN
jgi:hypothetical protein